MLPVVEHCWISACDSIWFPHCHMSQTAVHNQKKKKTHGIRQSRTPQASFSLMFFFFFFPLSASYCRGILFWIPVVYSSLKALAQDQPLQRTITSGNGLRTGDSKSLGHVTSLLFIVRCVIWGFRDQQKHGLWLQWLCGCIYLTCPYFMLALSRCFLWTCGNCTLDVGC